MCFFFWFVAKIDRKRENNDLERVLPITELHHPWVSAGADGPGGARDPRPEPSHVQQQAEELQAGDGEARERLCKYTRLATTFVLFKQVPRNVINNNKWNLISKPCLQS